MSLKAMFDAHAQAQLAEQRANLDEAHRIPALLKAVISHIFDHDQEFLVRFVPEAAPNFELFECHMASGQTRVSYVLGGLDDSHAREKYLDTSEVLAWTEETRS